METMGFRDPNELPEGVRSVLSKWRETSSGCEVASPRTQGFSGATIYRIATAAGMFCLRKWPEGGLPQARLRELHRFLRFLADRDINELAVPVPAADGPTLVRLNGRLWQLEPWKPGEADFKQNPSGARLRNAMHALARLHVAAAEYQPTARGAEWFFQSAAAPSPAVESRLKMIREWNSNRIRVAQADLDRLHEAGAVADEMLRVFVLCAPKIEAELSSVRESMFCLQPCLRDVWHDHVLFTGDEVTGLIDASAARSENVASDLSRLLGSLLEDDHPRWELALDAYSTVRPLSDRERGLVRLLDRSGVLLSPLHWVEACRSPHTQRNAGVMSHVIRRMNELNARLRSLAESIGGI